MLMPPPFPQLDKLLGMAMLIVASTVFLYYTIWTLFMVGSRFSRPESGPFEFRSYSPYSALP
jgi:hypothetical protein